MALSSMVSQLVSVIPFAELLCQTAASAQLMGLQAMAEGGEDLGDKHLQMSHGQQTL